MGRLLLTLLFTGWTALLAATNGLSPIGYGVKSKGMGGVAAALPQDSFISAVNPAGLIDLGCRLDLEISSTMQGANYQGVNAELDPILHVRSTSSQPLWWPGVGGTYRLTPCISAGLSAYILGANETKWNPPLVLVGNPASAPFPEIASEMQNYFIAITPALAWNLGCGQRFGVSANIVIATARVKGASLLSDQPLPTFVTDNGTDTATGVSLRVGWLGHFRHGLSAGLSLSTKACMSRFTKYQGFYGNYGGLQWPWSGIIGLSWSFCDCWLLALDYRYIQWKSVDAAYFSEFGSAVNIGPSRGLWDGPGTGWNNQGVAKLGIAWSPLSCLTLRAGYNYNTAFIPSSELLLGALVAGAIQHHVTLGATYLSCWGEVSGYYLHGFRHSVKGHGGLGPQVTNTFANVSNQQNELGLAWGWSF